MRIKSLALATTLSLLSTSALVGMAYAQKGMELEPQSSWAVKRVNADSPDAYCALARRFNQNMILTLAKNDQHEISLAIDFMEGRFETSRRYEISLDPGAGELRKFKVNPASSGKAFVLRVGSDHKFMSALSRTGYLRVNVEDETYNFNLADIDQGQMQLDACLYSGMTPAAGGGDTPSVSSYTQVANLRAEMENLEQRLQKLKQENEKLRLQSASDKKLQEGADQDAGSSSALKVTRSAAVDGLMTQIRSLKAENAELKKLVEASKNNVPVSTDVSVVALARENQRLQNLLKEQANVKEYKQQIEQLTKRITRLETENLALAQQKSSGLANDERQDLERQVMALKSENNALRDSIGKQSADNSSVVYSLRQDLSSLKQDNAQLNARISTLMRDKADVIEQLAFYEEENDRLRDNVENNASDTDILSQLRDEIRKIEGHNARLLAQKESEISALQTDLQALKTEHARLAASSDEEIRQAEETFKAKISALDIKNEALKEELILLSKDQALLDEFRGKVDSLMQEKLALQHKLDNAHVKISDLQKQIDTHQAKGAESEAEKIAMDHKIDDLKGEIASLRESMSDLSAENKRLEADLLARSDTREALIQNHKEELASLEAENKALKNDFAAYKKDQENGVDKVAALLDENAGLRDQLNQVNSEHLETVSALEESLAQLKQANATLREEAERKTASLEEEISALRDQLKKENSQQHASLDEKSQKIASLRDSVRALENENKDLVLALDNANTFNQTLQKDWSETLASYNSLKKEYEALEQKEIQSDADITGTEQAEKLAVLQKQNKHLNQQLEAQTREYLALVRDIEALKAQNNNANAQSVSMNVSEMKALREKNQVLKSQINVLRNKLDHADLPEVREAALQQDETTLDQMAEEARRKRDEELQQRQRQDQKRDAISRLAATEPAAGASNNVIENGQESAQKHSTQPSRAPDNTVRDVIEDLHMEDANLSVAQKLERSLKNQIERSERMPVDSSKGQYKTAALPDASTSKGIKPIEPVMQESIDTVHAASGNTAAAIQKPLDGLFAPSVNVAELLAAANIDLTAPLSLVRNSSGPDRVAYQWRSANDLYGSAHQKHISNIHEFDVYVREYLTMTEERCTGDFAIMPSSTEQVGQTRIDSYEIACVGNGINSSASVVFFNSDNTFTVLAHESTTEGMEMAMDARDKIVSTVDKT